LREVIMINFININHQTYEDILSLTILVLQRNLQAFKCIYIYIILKYVSYKTCLVGSQRAFPVGT
jgi:hypothetical protein